MVKDFNLLIENRYLLKEDEIGSEESDRSITSARSRNKLVAIKEVYRKFRSCLKRETRGDWLRIVEDEPIFEIYNYTIDNMYGVLNFETNHNSLKIITI